ncbi:hypothetical protein M426DRAFT_65441 [Hypoxylon sp. CI-4A]|nr:hypothetical protein M426DRAFT_65441 [Hypoxylon sp. CI-4A]
MAFTKEEKRRVYLACRPIFTGDKAQLRKAKKVREEIVKRPQALVSVNDFTIEKVVEITRDLLERRVFESELKAKVEFPELFYSSPAQEVQRETSEIDAAKSTAEALEEIVSSAEQVEAESDHEFEENVRPDEPPETEQEAPRYIVVLPSLYPTYIPYKAQHVILNEAQRMLEETCFEFAQKWLPAVLVEKGWDCASSVELTKWTRLLTTKADVIPSEAFHLTGMPPLAELLAATSKLRHSAVHRLWTTARGIQDLVKSAVALAVILGDHKRASQLEEICHELESKIKAMELNKNALENSTTAGLEDIKRQREELDRKEREVIASMVKNDQENRNLIGALLEDSMSRILEDKIVVEDEFKDPENARGACTIN